MGRALSMKLKDILLGLIELHPGATGYELKKIIEDSTGYFVSASLGQIYPALKELAEDGAVVFRADESEGGRDRKRYTATEEGRHRLEEVLRRVEPLPRSLSAFRQFLLHITFIGHLDDEDVDTYVRAQLEHFLSE
jgi:DNA-binding PadR family transcriptional regulator